MRTLVTILCVVGCGSQESTANPPGDANVSDASTDASTDAPVSDVTVDAVPDGASPLRRCVTSGKGSVSGDDCFLLTPAESGLPAGGVNADVDQYALRPTSGARGKLLLFFNGSGGSPLAGTRGSTTSSFYATARAAGLHVFGVSYRSDDTVGSLCKGDDACFLPTRRTIMTGTFEPGAAAALSGIAPHEGALVRLYAGLQTLATRDPGGGWSAYIDPAASKPLDKIRWPLLMTAGHSQGGGHAAVVGKAFAVDRVLALASPCDMTMAGPASWLDAAKSMFATSPALAFHGLGAPGDATCAGYASIWAALGLDASRRHADAIVCAGATAHSAPMECAENAPSWKKMME